MVEDPDLKIVCLHVCGVRLSVKPCFGTHRTILCNTCTRMHCICVRTAHGDYTAKAGGVFESAVR